MSDNVRYKVMTPPVANATFGLHFTVKAPSSFMACLFCKFGELYYEREQRYYYLIILFSLFRVSSVQMNRLKSFSTAVLSQRSL